MDQMDIDRARRHAAVYRRRKWNVLPSRLDVKRPFVRYLRYWNTRVPGGLLRRFPTSNLQVMTGRRWKLIVIDLDGEAAQRKWEQWSHRPVGHERTWIVRSGSGKGLHLWYTLPENYAKPLPKGFLWKGEEKHSGIERLCDLSLVMAPPSIHPETGNRYEFIDTFHSPKKFVIPGECPQWILDKPLLRPEPTEMVVPNRLETPVHSGPLSSCGRLAREVIMSIPDKIELASAWGVQFSGRSSPRGWRPCHAIDREDKRPSAAMHVESGTYVDLGSGTRLKFFDLAVALGAYGDWKTAKNHLGRIYGA